MRFPDLTGCQDWPAEEEALRLVGTCWEGQGRFLAHVGLSLDERWLWSPPVHGGVSVTPGAY